LNRTLEGEQSMFGPKTFALIFGVGLLVSGTSQVYGLAPRADTKKRKRHFYVYGVVEFLLGILFLIEAVFGYD
jgi:uncharacterized membrane protein HdeD (DUF308 family)